jgi:beta-glucosidase
MPFTSGEACHVGVSLSVTNTGTVTGSEVVQVYVTLPPGGPTTPKYQLRAFKKVKKVKPGDTREVNVVLDKYALSFWDVTAAEGKKTGVWRAREGLYRIAVGSSSVHHHLSGEFEVKHSFVWEGL